MPAVVFLALAGNAIQLVPDGTIVFHLVLILVMVALLNATLLKPINRILEERDRRTRGRLSEAQETLVRVDEKLRDYERQLREARAKGYALMEQQRTALSTEREQRLSSLRTEIGRELTDQKERLKQQSQQVRTELQSSARKQALEISRQILNREIAA